MRETREEKVTIVIIKEQTLSDLSLDVAPKTHKKTYRGFEKLKELFYLEHRRSSPFQSHIRFLVRAASPPSPLLAVGGSQKLFLRCAVEETIWTFHRKEEEEVATGVVRKLLFGANKESAEEAPAEEETE